MKTKRVTATLELIERVEKLVNRHQDMLSEYLGQSDAKHAKDVVERLRGLYEELQMNVAIDEGHVRVE